METEFLEPGEAIITPKEERRTGKYLTKFEIAKVVAVRANQIAAGAPYPASLPHDASERRRRPEREWALRTQHAPTYATLKDGARKAATDKSELGAETSLKTMLLHSDPVMIAKKELAARCLPFIVRRTFPDGMHHEDIPLWELKFDPMWLQI